MALAPLFPFLWAGRPGLPQAAKSRTSSLDVLLFCLQAPLRGWAVLVRGNVVSSKLPQRETREETVGKLPVEPAKPAVG